MGCNQEGHRGKHTKFEALWIGPFKISEAFPNNTYRLHNLEGNEIFGGPCKWPLPEKKNCLKPQLASHHCKYYSCFIFIFYFYLFMTIRLHNPTTKTLELLVLGSLQRACHPLWSQMLSHEVFKAS
jgi:hypothetical protein